MNLEGLYIGQEHYVKIDDDPHAVAMATGINTRAGSPRLLEFAFDHAVATGRRQVTIVHQANIMKAPTVRWRSAVRFNAGRKTSRRRAPPPPRRAATSPRSHRGRPSAPRPATS